MRATGTAALAAVLMTAAAAFPAAADVFRFSADRMTGGRAQGKETTVLIGHAQVVSDSLVLQADRIELTGASNRFIDCVGAVRGSDADKGVYFRTERLRYDRELKVARLEGDSALEDKPNGVVAKGRFIEYNDGAGLVTLQVGVRIIKDEMICRSEYAVYRRDEKILELSGMPVVFKDSDEFRSDRMRVNLDTDDILMEGAVTGTLQEKTADAAP
jgi:lipopolysaccharide export system protein LptA